MQRHARKPRSALWLTLGVVVWMVAVAGARASAPAGGTANEPAKVSAPAPRVPLLQRAGTPQAAAAVTPAAQAPAADPKARVKVCLDCHDEKPTNGILKSPHAVMADTHSPFGSTQCEACHGASREHVANSKNEATVVFSGAHASPVSVRNGACLTCHESGLRMNWQGSQHQRGDIACTNCHTSHVAKDPVLVKTSQPEKCFTCHPEQRAQANRMSHHPIIEGKVVCADCHNPHGSPQDKMLVRARVNDLCYKCHPDKRGPFLTEHAPVREDCTLCHTPHGSSQARLLKERVPYLCQECHDTGHHSGSPYGGETYIGGRAPQVQVSGRGCLNCHSQVHGSNSPSGAFNLR